MRHSGVVEAGLTHASSVIAFVRSRLGESGTVTQAFVPLKVSALPNRPAVVRTAFVSVPLFPVVEVSTTELPLGSSNP